MMRSRRDRGGMLPRRAAWSVLRRLLSAMLVVAVLLALTGCPSNGPAADDDPFGARKVIEILEAVDPPQGVIQVHDDLSVEWIGAGVLSDDAPDLPDPDGELPAGSDGTDETDVDETAFTANAFHVFVPATGNEFRLAFGGDLLADVHAFQEARGATNGTDGVEDPADLENAPIPQGWSNGTDGRFLRTATTAWPWRTISQFGSGDSNCTGTLIGPRHLITAAHCINRRGTDQWFTVQVDPARNGLNDSPYGSSTITLDPPPGTAAWYFTPAPWRTQACADDVATCRQWDWGMIVIPDRLGDQTGWMGYWAGPGSYLGTRTHYNRGYPKCDTTSAIRPSLCDTTSNGDTPFWARLFGDVEPCDLGSYQYPGPDGWNRTITHSCDTSGGHSGSAVYHYRQRPSSGQWVPVVSMVHGYALCGECASGVDHANMARRLTPSDLGVVSWLRNAFP